MSRLKTKFAFLGMTLTLALSSVASGAFVRPDKGNFAPKYESVAFIDTDVPENSYYTIESALASSKPGQTVYVRPGKNPVFMGKGSVPNDRNTVKNGVTLMLPVKKADGSFYEGWNVKEGEAVIANSYKFQKKDNTLVTSLAIGEGATLYNYGTITIGGELSGGGGAGASAGHTEGNYAEILMHQGSRIVNGSVAGETGLIKCLGYISEASGAASDVILHRGELRMPFLVRDFRGGNASLSIYYPYTPIGGTAAKHSISPFNQFEMRNVESRLTLSYHSILTAYCNLYAGDKHNATMGKIIGNGSDALIQLTDPDHSYFVGKYHKENEVCDVDLYGGAKMNSLTLEIQVPLAGTVTINTSDVFFPLSWRHAIHLHAGENQGKAFYDLTSKLKLLPGASLDIDEKVEVNAHELTSFDYSVSPRVDPGFNDLAYPMPGTKYIQDAYPLSKQNAKITVRGTLKAQSIGGVLSPDTRGPNGLLTISTSASQTTYEGKESKRLSNCVQDTLVNSARGKLAPESAPSNLAIASYFSRGTHWLENKVDYTISYQAFIEPQNAIVPNAMINPASNPVSGNTSASLTLQDPTYQGSLVNIKFAGWYYRFDSSTNTCSNPVQDNILVGTEVFDALDKQNHLTLTARFVAAREIKVHYLSRPDMTDNGFDTSKEVALTGVDYLLPDGSALEFYEPGNACHRVGVFYAWKVLTGKKEALVPGEFHTGDRITIPSDYPDNEIFLVATTAFRDDYKLLLDVRTGAHGSAAGMAEVYYGSPESRIINGGSLVDFQNRVEWIPLGSPVRIWIDHWGRSNNKLSIETRSINGDAQLTAPKNNPRWFGSLDVAAPAMDERGMRLIFDGHR